MKKVYDMKTRIKARKIGLGVLLLLTVMICSLFFLVQWKLEARKKADAPQISAIENDIIIKINNDSQVENIRLWLDKNGQAYVFLPTYAKLSDCYLEYSGDSYQIICDGRFIEAGKDLSWVSLDYNYSFAAANQTLSVIFMKSSQINTMYLDTASGNMDYIHETKGNEEAGTMRLYDSMGNVEYDGALDRIKGRGNNSWYNEKKAYQIRTAEEADLLGMGEAKTWILIAGAGDASLLRNKIVYDMAKKIGIPFSQDSDFVDLYLNGQYNGTYMLTEKIEIAKNRVDIENLEDLNEDMNPESDIHESETFVSEDGNQWGITGIRNPADITGGYLLERDNFFEDEVSAFRLNSGEKFSLGSPKYATKEEIAYISSVMQHIENAILAEDGKDPETGKDYKELIDFKGLVYKYLMDEVTKCDDGWRGSNYFYKLSDTVDSKVYLGPVWDYDLSLGNAPEWFVGDDNPQGIIQPRLSTWYQALWKKEEFRRAVLDAYHSVFRPYFKEITDNYGQIDQYTDYVSDSASMNLTRWKDKIEYYTVFNSYEEQIDYLKYFIQHRLSYIDSVWDDGVVYHEVLFKGVPKLYDRTDKWEYQYVLDGECATIPATPTKLGYRFKGWYYEGTEEPFSQYQPVWSDTTIVALWEEEPQTVTEEATNTRYTISKGNFLVSLILFLVLAGILGVFFYKGRE